MKQNTNSNISLAGLTEPDINLIQRRRTMHLCGARIAADLRQLADEIAEYDRMHNEQIKKIRECVDVPHGVSFVK